jgi:hypothetical protein
MFSSLSYAAFSRLASLIRMRGPCTSLTKQKSAEQAVAAVSKPALLAHELTSTHFDHFHLDKGEELQCEQVFMNKCMSIMMKCVTCFGML